MSGATNEAIQRWLISLYCDAQDMPLPAFKDELFTRLGQFIPLSSAVWANTGPAPEGGVDCFAMHLFQAPDTLAEEIASANRRHPQAMRKALQQPGQAHSICTLAFTGKEYASLRDYAARFGHQNCLVSVDRAPRTDRSEWFSLYRSRADDCFTPGEERLMSLLLPHLTEALAISRALSQAHGAETGSALAGTRALVQPNGVMLTCGEQFKRLLRRHWPDWFSARLPPELLDSLGSGPTHIPAQEERLLLTTRKLGPYLLVQIEPPRTEGILTARQAQIARLFAGGKRYRAIASDVGLKPATVRNVLQAVYRKLEVGNKAELVRALRPHMRSAAGGP